MEFLEGITMRANKILTFLSILLFGFLTLAPRIRVQETNLDWPRQIDSSIGQIILYEPQPDSIHKPSRSAAPQQQKQTSGKATAKQPT
jgi:hypothetical protein